MASQQTFSGPGATPPAHPMMTMPAVTKTGMHPDTGKPPAMPMSAHRAGTR